MLRVRGCDSIPKTCIPQVTIQFATCTPQGCDSIRPASCDCRSFPIPPIKPATHRLRFESKLRFQSQNLHPAGCDSIRNLQVAIPVPKPASRRLRFNSQPALRRLRIESQPASCDSSPKSLQPAGCDSL